VNVFNTSPTVHWLLPNVCRALSVYSAPCRQFPTRYHCPCKNHQHACISSSVNHCTTLLLYWGVESAGNNLSSSLHCLSLDVARSETRRQRQGDCGVRLTFKLSAVQISGERNIFDVRCVVEWILLIEVSFEAGQRTLLRTRAILSYTISAEVWPPEAQSKGI